jgi:hypothetical protein
MKLKHLLLTFVSAAFLLNACKKDKAIVQGNITFKPISFEQQIVGLDTTVTLSFVVESTNNLDSITAKTFLGADTTDLGTVIKYSENTKKDTVTFNVNSGNKIGNRLVRFFVVDAFKNKANISFSLTVVGAIQDSTDTVYVGTLYNTLSGEASSWDLVNNVALSPFASSNNADMSIEASLTGFDGSWEAGLGNGTMFVLGDSLDFVNENFNNSADVYENGTPSSSVSNPEVGQVYVARLRNSNAYAVIRIDEVDPANSDCNCPATGRLTFSYKK